MIAAGSLHVITGVPLFTTSVTFFVASVKFAVSVGWKRTLSVAVPAVEAVALSCVEESAVGYVIGAGLFQVMIGVAFVIET